MQPQKILVVDDSNMLHKMYDLLLSAFPRLHAYDGHQALHQLEQNSDIDLVLLDVRMPRMNGLEVLSRLKNGDEFNQIPVVMISTEGQEEETIRAIEMGAAAYIKKPFSNQDLLQVIAELEPADLRQRRSTRPSSTRAPS